MRKFIFMTMLALFMLASCEEKENKEFEQEEQKIESLIVENVISTDREFMFLNFDEDYRWYETCILMQDFMDEDPSDNVEAVTSIFQIVTERETGFDTQVVMTVCTLDTNTVEVVKGFWVEDFPMNSEEITLTFSEAWNKVMETNCPKPHSRQCVLRKEIGPKAANPQYIFGNSKGQIFVDAVTGEVSEHNPVILEGPLGEWP